MAMPQAHLGGLVALAVLGIPRAILVVPWHATQARSVQGACGDYSLWMRSSKQNFFHFGEPLLY